MTRNEAAARAAIEDSAIPPAGSDCFLCVGHFLPAYIYTFRRTKYMWEEIKKRQVLYALVQLLIMLLELIPDFTDPLGVGDRMREQRIYTDQE